MNKYKIVPIVVTLIGLGLIGLSGYSAQMLADMLNAETDFWAQLGSSDAEAVMPTTGWLGTGPAGIYAPTVLAMFGTIMILIGLNNFSDGAVPKKE